MESHLVTALFQGLPFLPTGGCGKRTRESVHVKPTLEHVCMQLASSSLTFQYKTCCSFIFNATSAYQPGMRAFKSRDPTFTIQLPVRNNKTIHGILWLKHSASYVALLQASRTTLRADGEHKSNDSYIN